jgi:hypothetical protein
MSIGEKFAVNGETLEIVDECPEFVVAKRADGTLRVEPQGEANEALLKAIYGVNTRDDNDTDAMYARMLRADALEEVISAYKCLVNKKSAPPDSTELMAKAFGEIIWSAVRSDSESDWMKRVESTFTAAIRAIRNRRALERDQVGSTKTRRVLLAMEVGKSFFLKNRKPPAKHFIRKEIEEAGLSFGGSTLKKQNEQWKTFWEHCGLSNLPK